MDIKSLEEDTFSKIVSLVNKGRLKENTEHYLNAIAFYDQALDTYPKDENEYYGQKHLYELLGNCFEKQEDLNKAVIYFEKAYRCHEGSKDKDILLKISSIYSQLNDDELSKHYTNLCINK